MESIAVIGGGNLGHSLALILSQIINLKVYIVTRNPDLWSNKVIFTEKDNKYTGNINILSYDNLKVLKECSFIFLTVPSIAYVECLNKIKNNINKDCYIGSFPSMGGFTILAPKILGSHIKIFGSQRVPFICRIEEYGKSVNILDRKKEIKVFFKPYNKNIHNKLCEWLSMSIVSLDSCINILLNNSNPILHTSRLFNLFSINQRYDYIPLFYKEWTNDTSSLLINMDKELKILTKKIVPSSNYTNILTHYGVNNMEELTQKIRSIKSLQNIKTPVKRVNNYYIGDINNRYFIEDGLLNLVLILDIANLFDCPVLYIKKVIDWILNYTNSNRNNILYNTLNIKNKEEFYKIL